MQLLRGVSTGHDLERAVFTIPVDFEVRSGALFVKRLEKQALELCNSFMSQSLPFMPTFELNLTKAESLLASKEGPFWFSIGVVARFDLTICRITGGSIMQVRNLGDNEVGGDKFDDRLRNHLREKHALAHGLENITALECPGMNVKLLHQCEILKINLSDPDVNIDDAQYETILWWTGLEKTLLHR